VAYFARPPNGKKRSAEDHIEAPRQKKARTSPSASAKNTDTNPSNASLGSSKKIAEAVTLPKASKHQTKGLVLEKLVKKRSSPANVKSRHEEDEDRYITYLESQLGLVEKGNKAKSSEDDGLDGM